MAMYICIVKGNIDDVDGNIHPAYVTGEVKTKEEAIKLVKDLGFEVLKYQGEPLVFNINRKYPAIKTSVGEMSDENPFEEEQA